MVMCSINEQKSQNEKIKFLQSQNQSLIRKLSKDGGSGYCKFTIPLGMDTFQSLSFSIQNFNQVTPRLNNYLMNMIKCGPKVVLPSKGLHSFQIFVTNFLKKQENSIPPSLYIGVACGDKVKQEVALIKLSSAYQRANQASRPTEKNWKGVLEQYDTIRIILNMDTKQMTLEKNFRIYDSISWESSQQKEYWPYIKPINLGIKTDIFIQQENILWGLTQKTAMIEQM